MMRRHVLRVEGLEVESPYLRWSRAVSRWLSRWRAELATAAAAWGIYRLLCSAAGVWVTRILLLVAVAGAMAWPVSREYARRTGCGG